MRAWLDTRVDQAGRDRTSLLPRFAVSVRRSRNTLVDHVFPPTK